MQSQRGSLRPIALRGRTSVAWFFSRARPRARVWITLFYRANRSNDSSVTQPHACSPGKVGAADQADGGAGQARQTHRSYSGFAMVFQPMRPRFVAPRVDVAPDASRVPTDAHRSRAGAGACSLQAGFGAGDVQPQKRRGRIATPPFPLSCGATCVRRGSRCPLERHGHESIVQLLLVASLHAPSLELGESSPGQNPMSSLQSS